KTVYVELERTSTVGRVVEAGCVASQGKRTIGRVKAVGSVALERTIAVGRVLDAGCVAKERIKTHCRVRAAALHAEERTVTLSGVFVAQASIRCPSARRIRKQGPHERDEKKTEWQRRPAG